MSYKPGDSYYKEFTTQRFDTGAATDADTTPTATANHNGTDDAANMPLTVTKIDTGRYKVTGTVYASYAAGDVINVSAAATVNSVSGKAIIDSFQLDANRLADVVTAGGNVKSDLLYLDGAQVHSATASRLANNLTTMFNVATQNFTGAMFGATASFTYTSPTGASVNVTQVQGRTAADVGVGNTVYFGTTGGGTSTLVVGAAMTLTSAYDSAKGAMQAGNVTVGAFASGVADALAVVIEGHLLNDSDGQALLAAIVAKINATDVDLAGLSVSAVASAAATSVAAAILSNPAYKLLVDVNGKVTINNTIPTPPTVGQIRTEMETAGGKLDLASAAVTDSGHGNAALAEALAALTTSSGSGPYGITLTAKDADGYTLEGVSVYLNKAGETYKGLTDAHGEYHCDADTIGTWTIRASHPIYQYAGGTLTTTADGATMDIPMTRLTIEPAPTGQTTLAVTVLDNDLQPVADATVQIQVSAAPADSAGYSFDGDSIYLNTDANGLATHRVLAGALCRVLAGGNGWVQFTASMESTTQIASYVRTKP